MADAKFTPGGWEYTPTVAFHDRPDLPCVVDQHRLVVAQCWDDGHSEDECEANAHLIAAAPDLYEALDQLLYAEGVSRGVALENARVAAHRALAKARGQ